jgi:hypothetical protein
MTILAIDPGPTHSATVELLDDGQPCGHKGTNEGLLAALATPNYWPNVTTLVIEMVASYGMPVGREVFETVFWAGRFAQAWKGQHVLMYRKDVKLHLCNSPRANDATIRQALIDRYGGKEKAIGKKASPGALYGIKADVWSALAIAVTYSDQQAARRAA